MSEKINYSDRATEVLGYFIHETCKKYAIKKMSKEDWILFTDANMKQTEDVLIGMGKNRRFHTIKNSSCIKYQDFYDEKLDKILEKLSK